MRFGDSAYADLKIIFGTKEERNFSSYNSNKDCYRLPRPKEGFRDLGSNSIGSFNFEPKEIEVYRVLVRIIFILIFIGNIRGSRK